MNRFQRRPLLRWTGRLLLLFVACESSLRFASAVGPRLLGRPASSDGAIVCIGDSNTFGLGAPPGRSYPDQLRQLLAKDGLPRDVVNLGISGFKSAEAVDRLEDSLRDATPGCVIFLAAVNDRTHNDRLADPGADTAGARVHALARRLLTVRVAETALYVLRGDVAREEFGGHEPPRFDPTKLFVEDFDEEYPAAKAAGVDGVFAWLSQVWHHERPELAERVWRDFTAAPEFPRIASRFRLPTAAYEWELARMNGRLHAPLASPAPPADAGFPAEFARFTAAIDALEQRRLASARAGFLELADLDKDPRWQAFMRMHAGWARLLAREFRGAADELTIQADKLAAASPFPGLAWAMGGASVAALLRNPGNALAGFTVGRAEAWTKVHGSAWSPLAREWIFAAELIEAARREDDDFRARTLERFERALGAARTAPLRWLLAHPDAKLEEIRAELPLEPPLASWIGPSRAFVPWTTVEEMRRLLEQSALRLDALAAKHGFRIVALTYLNYESEECNDALRDLARSHGWPLVDFHTRYADLALGVDDKARYFCADRGHPNEAGYGLMAEMIRDELKRLGIVR
jgi:lysophospholipase L1-like esterase